MLPFSRQTLNFLSEMSWMTRPWDWSLKIGSLRSINSKKRNTRWVRCRETTSSNLTDSVPYILFKCRYIFTFCCERLVLTLTCHLWVRIMKISRSLTSRTCHVIVFLFFSLFSVCLTYHFSFHRNKYVIY